MKTYTLKEIKHYFEGCLLLDMKGTPLEKSEIMFKEWNMTLKWAIKGLSEEHSGIDAVTRQYRKDKAKKKK